MEFTKQSDLAAQCCVSAIYVQLYSLIDHRMDKLRGADVGTGQPRFLTIRHDHPSLHIAKRKRQPQKLRRRSCNR